MLGLLWLVPALPLLGFLLLAFFGRRLPGKSAGAIGAASVGLSAAAAVAVAAAFISSPPPGGSFHQVLWRWLDVAGLSAGVAFHLDALSVVMVLVVTFVGFLIHIYSMEYMEGEEGYARYFAYMNLFVTSMLVLVLAEDLLLLYLGWEGVGLSSYLLIGFWYRDPANGRAARKAFIVTRVGDTAMALGLFLIFWELGTLGIQDALGRARGEWPVGSTSAVAAAALLLGGAVGKSAQLPLQTWLPDAMAGPTPVSALIHAATMVTAGVYLIARTHVLFELAPAVQLAVGVVGALTLLLAGASALVQTDLKRVLAYSTISQIGYMFLALGVGAWSAALFHFMTHAIFKALLFLAAGAVILAHHHEQDLFKMGGLRRRIPFVFWTFLIGAASLAALPLVTAGFYSKDLILWRAFAAGPGGGWLWAAGLAGALLTSIYTFRMVFLVFFGPPKGEVHRRPGPAIAVPLGILALLSLAGGFLETPPYLGRITAFRDFLDPVFGPAGGEGGLAIPSGHGEWTELVVGIGSMAVSVAGVLAACVFFLWRPSLAAALRARAGPLHGFLLRGWDFDRLYDRLFVRPLLGAARINRDDFIDRPYAGIARLTAFLHAALSRSQDGRLRWYALGITAGAIVLLTLMVLS